MGNYWISAFSVKVIEVVGDLDSISVIALRVLDTQYLGTTNERLNREMNPFFCLCLVIAV